MADRLNPAGITVDTNGVVSFVEAQELAFGMTTVIFDAPGATDLSQVRTVAHGLDGTPVVILCTLNDPNRWVTFRTFNPAAATFDIQARSDAGAFVATLAVYWLAAR